MWRGVDQPAKWHVDLSQALSPRLPSVNFLPLPGLVLTTCMEYPSSDRAPGLPGALDSKVSAREARPSLA